MTDGMIPKNDAIPEPPDNELYRVTARSASYELWLPQASTDHIQRSVASSGAPYEGAMLAASLQWLDGQATIVDVGGNIGTHTVFWGVHGHPVVMFEPDAASFEVARANVTINGLTDLVELHAIALGDRQARGRCENDSAGNSGATRVVLDAEGEVIIRTLDSYGLRGVGLIKMDVEGMEASVLEGARYTIERERPLLLVETLGLDELRALVDRTAPLGYVHWETFNASPTQLFIPNEKLNASTIVEHAGRIAIERFNAVVEAQTRQAELARANDMYRTAVEQIAVLKDRLAARSGSNTMELAKESGQLAAKGAEIEALTARVAHLSVSYERAVVVNSQLTEQVSQLSASLASVRAYRDTVAAEKLAVSLELDGVRKDVEKQAQARELALEASRVEIAEMSAELTRLRDMVGDAWDKHTQATSQLVQLQDHLSTQASAHALQLAELRELVQQVIAQRDDAGRHAEDLAERLEATDLENEQLRVEVVSARTRVEELAKSNSRRAEEMRALGHRVNLHERTIASLHADKMRMADRLRDVGRERAELKRRLDAIRSSRAYQLGRVLREGLGHPASLLHLPGRLARTVRRHNATIVSTQTPKQVDSADPLAIGSPEPASTSKIRSDYLLPRLKASAAGVEFSLPPRTDVRVASILDEFSYACFAPEGDFFQLTPQNWRAELEAQPPDLLLVESAWRGKDNLWRNMVAKCGPEILGILQWCKSRGIPTAFWNKEDPVHFSTFLSLAAHFDAVFTTDVDCIPRYKERLGHERVYLLPFAAQPRLHNPLEVYERENGFAFAGAYYTRYPDRTADLESFVKELPSAKDLVIFDRMHGQDDPQYMFPERYRRYIVGRLEPNDIQVAYKGYSTGINLNSVKNSQSMFARRVFELMASNTLVVSNFSPALRLLFGDLVIATDSGKRVVQILDELGRTPQGELRLRAQGVRKVLRESTYDDRLATICERLGIDRPNARQPVALVAAADSAEDIAKVQATVLRQSTPPDVVVLLTDSSGEERWGEIDVMFVDSAEHSEVPLGDFLGGSERVAMLSPSDYYGPYYLEDLLLAGRYSAAPTVGKSGAFCWSEGNVTRSEVTEYAPVESIALRRALVERAEVALLPIGELAENFNVRHSAAVHQLQIDGFGYAKDGAAAPATALAQVDAHLVNEGHALEKLVSYADASELSADIEDTSEDELSWFVDKFAGVAGAIEVKYDGALASVSSTLDAGTHAYAYAPDRLSIVDLGWAQKGTVYVDVGPGLDLQLAILFFAADGQRLSHTMATPNRNHRFAVPEGTVEVAFGLRASGPGRLTLRRVVTHEVIQQTAGLMSVGSTVVLTNVYPSYDNLYRNGFVHSRVMAYRDAGLEVDVVRLADVASPQFREFEGVRVIDLSADELIRMLRRNNVSSVLVHFLDADMWDVIGDPNLGVKVHVWIHGSEIQPWWRREYNALNEEDLEKAKLASAVRLAFWQEVFSSLPEHIDFVFVSEYFANEVMTDVGVRLPEDRYRVIHNPIDDDLFDYVAKPDEQRRKILTIRPYASRKYANDLSVAAVLALRDEPFFDSLQFSFIGDGPMFDEVLEPIRELPNVHCEKRFLTRSEIAAMHKEYGVFLTPTRMDAQGVSRDEAMASGLVPISSAVAAVPEFVDENSGILAPAEDHIALARGVSVLVGDPAMFQRLSKNAAARVRRQSGKSVVLVKELDLIEGRDSWR